MTPILLQRGPEILKYLDELLILVFMVAGAILPAIKQAREKKRADEKRKGTSERAAATGAPSAADEGTARRQDLEDRVRAYFEERSRPAAPAAPEPPPVAPRAAAAEPPAAHRLATGFADVHVDLKEIEHLSRTSTAGAAPPRARGAEQRAVRRPRLVRGLRSTLRTRDALKQAIVLKEILGPPKGLEGLDR